MMGLDRDSEAIEPHTMGMGRMPDSGAVSFEIGGKSSRIKSSTEHDHRPPSKNVDF